ncbi:MAG: GFA family protein [Deltaproteobacteria bacterium]|nr:GFA family protein [Deltaproteobacteria bacterium]
MPILTGGCHCGLVQYQLDTQLKHAAVCNCSICLKKGVVNHRVKTDQFQLTQGEEHLTDYLFNTKLIRHRFCSVCGIHLYILPVIDQGFVNVNLRTVSNPLPQWLPPVPPAGVSPQGVEWVLFDGAHWEEVAKAPAPLPASQPNTPLRKYQGGCHCGQVRFGLEARLDRATLCNCSLCAKKAAVLHRVAPEAFHLLSGADRLTDYRFATKTARHLFCSTCGIHAFNHPRINPDHVVVNLRCLDNPDPAWLPPPPVHGARTPGDPPGPDWIVFDGARWDGPGHPAPTAAGAGK